MRKEINSIVREFALKNGGCYQKSWNMLYKMYNKVMHQNIKSRATRRNIKPIDVIDSEGNLEFLKVLAENLFVA